MTLTRPADLVHALECKLLYADSFPEASQEPTHHASDNCQGRIIWLGNP